MKPVYCAAVDLGATSGRVTVGAWANGRLRLTEVHRFANQFRSLSGRDYWDLPTLWAEVSSGLLKARKRFPGLASVGVDAWAVDHALVDRHGRLVHPVHAYRDCRTQKLSKRLDRRGMNEVYALTGIPNYPYNTSLQLKETLAAFPGIDGLVARCLFIPDYFNFLLTGRMENELSVCSHSQLLDVRGLDWSPGALSFFGIPPRWFAKPALSPRKLGPVTGLNGWEGVQSVLVPGHDTACAFTAMPAASDRSDLYLSSGTWSLMGFEADAPVLGAEALSARISNERMGDGTYRPLRSCLGLWLLERTLLSFSSRPKNAAAWARLISAAAKAPRPKALLDVADPSLFNPPDMRAAIAAQLRRRGAKPPRDLAGHVRLITESLGRGHADAVRVFERVAKRTFKRIIIVGGGSKNRLLCQATADASGLPVVSYSLEGTVVGNVASQLIALGAVRTIAEFRGKLALQLKGTKYTPRH
jgi:rhamnulokinase